MNKNVIKCLGLIVIMIVFMFGLTKLEKILVQSNSIVLTSDLDMF